MSDLSYMIWFLATAAMTIAVLTVGTLAAAGMLPGGDRGRDHRRRRTGRRSRAAQRLALTETTTAGTVRRTGPNPADVQGLPDHEYRAA